MENILQLRRKIPEQAWKTVLGILLFWLLGSYARIDTGIDLIYIYLQYPILCLFAWQVGPLGGTLIGLCGHTLVAFTRGGMIWWSWIMASAVLGLLMGLARERSSGKRLSYTLGCLVSCLVTMGVLAPLLNMLLYRTDAATAFRQGLFAALSDGLVSVLAGQLVFGSIQRTGFRKVVALIVMVDALLLLSYGRSGFGNFAVYLLAVVSSLYAIFGGWIRKHSKHGWAFALRFGILCLIVLLVFMMVFVMIAGYTNGATGDEQAVVVLGAGLDGDQPTPLLQARLDQVVTFAEKHPQVIIVCSGGQGSDEIVSEGEAMRSYLLSKGLAPERVLAETRSATTEENFLFSRELLLAEGYPENVTIAYATSDYHCYRAGIYAELAGFEFPRAIPAFTSPASLLPCLIRECGSVVTLVAKLLTGG